MLKHQFHKTTLKAVILPRFRAFLSLINHNNGTGRFIKLLYRKSCNREVSCLWRYQLLVFFDRSRKN